MSITLALTAAAAPGAARAAAPAPKGAGLSRPIAETFGDHPLFGEAGSGVNTATGDYVRTEHDLAVTGLLAWTRTYNSLDPSNGEAGLHWTSSFSARLDIAADGSAAFHDDDGRVLTFAPDGSGGYRTPQDIDAVLSSGAAGYTLRYRSGETWTFDSGGRLTSRARGGETVTPAYDGQGRLASVASSTGASLTVDRDASGRITGVKSSDGRAVSFQYAASGALVKATGTDGGSVTYQNDASGELATVLGQDGQPQLSNGYDGTGRVASQTVPGQGTVDFSYDTSTGTTTMTSGTDSAERADYVHDGSGHLVQADGPQGQQLTQAFDSAGRLLSATLPGGIDLGLTYDGRGNVTRRTLAGAATSYAYDAEDRVTASTDESGATTHYSYAAGDRIPDAITDPAGGTTHYTLADGLVTRIVDPDGGTTSLTYDGSRRVVSATDADNGTTRYRYDAAGDLTARVAPSGATTSYSYDAAGRLTGQTSPSGAATAYHWSPTGELLSTTAPDGTTTRNTYNDAGQQTATSDPLGRSTAYAYDTQGNLSTSTDPGGAVTSYTYDALGRMQSSTDPDGVQTQYTYDAAGNQTSQTAPAGTTKTTYDARGNVTSNTDAMGRTTTYQYDAAGRQIARTDPTGAVWRTTYDAAGRVLTTTDPDGHTTTRSWTAAGLLASITDPLGRTTRYTYDAAGHQLTVTDPAGGTTRYTYDADGDRTSMTTAAGLVTRYRYDADGHLTDTVDPTGGVTHDTYDARGNKTSETDPAGAVRRMTYDAAGQLLKATDPDGNTTAYGYDAAGDLTSITDANGRVTRMTYDAAKHLTSLTDPLDRTTKNTYDAAGNLVTVTDPDGKQLTMAYDADNELTKRQGWDGSAVGFGYDADGRRASMTDASGRTGYAYDPAGLLTTVTEPDGRSLKAAYDAASERTGLTYPDGLRVGYTYDLNGRLTAVDDSKAGQARYTLDPDGRLLTEDLPDAWRRTYHYTSGVLDDYRQTHHGLPIASTGITHDADGRITALTGEGLTPDQTFGYDAAGRLLTATGQPYGTFKAAYDAVGNLTSVTRGHWRTTNTYDPADELTSAVTGDDTTSYGYDSSGRLVSTTRGHDTVTTAYNGLGLPVTTTDDPGLPGGLLSVTAADTYNGDGQLVTRTLSKRLPVLGETELSRVGFTWSAGDPTPEIISEDAKGLTGTWVNGTTDFSYGYSRVAADAPWYSATFAKDVFGSTVATPATLPWAQDAAYDVLGAPANPLADVVQRFQPRFGYRGELAFGSSLDLRARTYDTALGRFTSRDPVSNYAGRPDPASPYAYADDDPVNATDPLGKSALSDAFALLDQDILSVFQSFGAFFATAANACPDPGNGIDRHQKCFQNVLWWTRGFITDGNCLNADPDCLNTYWNSGRKEYAADAFTIHQLDWNRQSVWDSFLNHLGWSTDLSQDVDWEVSPSQTGVGAGRIDIVTEEKQLFEVKDYRNRGMVAAQIQRYVTMGANAGITFVPSTELQDWADAFQVTENWWDVLFGGSTVYVWGLDNPAGHIYFAKDDDAPSNVRTKVWWDQHLGCFTCVPVPEPIPEPVPVPA